MSNEYPFPVFKFTLSLESNSKVMEITFQEVTGINKEIEVVNYSEGGENNFKHLLPSSVKTSNLVLKRGYAQKGHPILDWCQQSMAAGLGISIQTNNILIHLLDETHSPVFSWRFEDAWPIKILVSESKSSPSEIIIEEIEFSYNNFKKLL